MKAAALTTLLLASLFALPSWAQESKQEEAPAPPQAESENQEPDEPQPAPAPDGKESEQPSAEEVLKELLKKRAESPLQQEKKPAAPAAEAKPPVRANQPIAPVESHKPVGTAPKALRTPIEGLPDGAIIVARKGRMVRSESADASGWLLTFDSDSSNLDDPPLRLLPCQELERAESLLEQHGEGTPMLVFGQVFSYRGQSYLLPTQLRVAPNRGNLE